MRLSIALLGLVTMPSILPAQWSVTNAGSGARKDDIFFIGSDTGWVAGGAEGVILRTYDAGDSWLPVHFGPSYLRSIEFATPQTGFCGTLDNVFLRSTDGGSSWTDIASQIPSPSSVCGLCAPSADRIYGAGVWFSPAYVVRSTDGGQTWSKTDLSDVASAMVDVYFLNEQTGFASGKAQPDSLGGIILRTDDGGDTWNTVHLTGQAGDYIWKLQSPDGIHIFGSIDATFGVGGTRFVYSGDAGGSWSTRTATTDYHYIQAIGFLDPLTGWMGGNQTLLKTTDGGDTWFIDNTLPGSCYDRFHRVGPGEAYLCGCGVYRYADPSVGTSGPLPTPQRDGLSVTPNPARDEVRIRLVSVGRSQAIVTLHGADGRLINRIHHGAVPSGETVFPHAVGYLEPGNYFVTVRTDQGQSVAPFVKE